MTSCAYFDEHCQTSITALKRVTELGILSKHGHNRRRILDNRLSNKVKEALERNIEILFKHWHFVFITGEALILNGIQTNTL